MHHVNVEVSCFGMVERAGQRAHDVEPKVLPQTDRRRVGGNHEVELHCAKTEPARFAQAMLGHCATDSPPARAC